MGVDVYTAREAGGVIRLEKKSRMEGKKKPHDMSWKHDVSWIMQKISPILRAIHIIVQELSLRNPMQRIQIGQTEKNRIRG